MNTDLQGTQILLIGGSGGIGSALVNELIRQGTTSIVVASQKPASAWPHAGVMSETVDITRLDSVQSLAARLSDRDLSVVINCAGINGNRRLNAADAVSTARREMDVNYFGTLHVGNVFAPLLAQRGGGTMINMLSFLSHVNLPLMASYCASKAAAHSLTQALRAEWRAKAVRVCGIYPTAVDTTMSAELSIPKLAPDQLAFEVIAALIRGDEDVYPGDASLAYAGWLEDPRGLELAMADALAP